MQLFTEKDAPATPNTRPFCLTASILHEERFEQLTSSQMCKDVTERRSDRQRGSSANDRFEAQEWAWAFIRLHLAPISTLRAHVFSQDPHSSKTCRICIPFHELVAAGSFGLIGLEGSSTGSTFTTPDKSVAWAIESAGNTHMNGMHVERFPSLTIQFGETLGKLI